MAYCRIWLVVDRLWVTIRCTLLLYNESVIQRLACVGGVQFCAVSADCIVFELLSLFYPLCVDGRRPFPVNHGPTTPDSFFQVRMI